MTVLVVAFFLYLFFQGYYLNIDFNINKPKQAPILKQFWIINLKAFPNPDNIFIWWKGYGNGSKTIYDYGKYKTEIYKKWYIWVVFDIILNQNYPIYYDTVNLFKKLTYVKMVWVFDDITKVDDYYFVQKKWDKLIEVYNQKLKPIKSFLNDYIYLGYKYFQNNGSIYVYDFENNLLKPYISKDTGLEVKCNNPRVMHSRLFCFDIMDFIDGSMMQWNEKVLRINSNIILTENYIYNNWNWWDWGTYEHANKFIYDPDNLVHIDNMPFIVEDGYLYNLENKKKTQFTLPEIDIVKKSFEFSKETLLVWYKEDETVFVLIDEKRKYYWDLWKIDPSKIDVMKLNWAYIFNTGNNLYLYYKGSESLTKILTWDDISIIDNLAFFKKDWINYTMDLNEE